MSVGLIPCWSVTVGTLTSAAPTKIYVDCGKKDISDACPVMSLSTFLGLFTFYIYKLYMFRSETLWN